MVDGAHTPVDVNWPSQLMDETSSTISPDSFIMKLPSALTPVMLEYVQSIGLYEVFSACITSPC